jgi:hypothetical protein
LPVFWPAFGVAPKVTYRQYAPIGAPCLILNKIRRNLCVFICLRDPYAGIYDIITNMKIRGTESKPVDAIPNQGRQNNLFVDIHAHVVNIFII